MRSRALGVNPATIFGVLEIVHFLLDGSMRSGEKAKSISASDSPDSLTNIGKTTLRVVPGSTVDSMMTSVPAFKFLPTEVVAEISALRSGFEASSNGVGTQIAMIEDPETAKKSVVAEYLPALTNSEIEASEISSTGLFPAFN